MRSTSPRSRVVVLAVCALVVVLCWAVTPVAAQTTQIDCTTDTQARAVRVGYVAAEAVLEWCGAIGAVSNDQLTTIRAYLPRLYAQRADTTTISAVIFGVICDSASGGVVCRGKVPPILRSEVQAAERLIWVTVEATPIDAPPLVEVQPPPVVEPTPVPTPGPCTYIAPTSTTTEARAIGTILTGYNVITTATDRQKQAERVFQLEAWGWDVRAHPDSGRLLVFARCRGLEP